MTLVSDFIAGIFSFPSVSSPGRQMDAHTPQLVQFPLADQVLCVVCWPEIEWLGLSRSLNELEMRSSL